MSKKFVNFDNDDSVSKYFKEVRKSEILTQEQELQLAIRIQNGDERAVEELVQANLKFVISVAKEFQGQGLPLSDLINEGNLGLVKAASRFDHTRGWRFISYAVWWIRQAIMQSLNENARTIRLPANVIAKNKSIEKEMKKFEFENERMPVYGDIIDDETKAPVDLSVFPKCASLNEAINEEGDELIELIAAEGDDENALVIDERVKNEIDKMLSTLDTRERHIIECYFGLNTGCESMTLDAIGERYNLTKERIRQIKEKAIRKLRHNTSQLFTIMNE